MKSKILLLATLMSIGILRAQEDTINSLIITEACLKNNYMAYIEISNIGDEDIQLANFKLGNLTPDKSPWNPDPLNLLPLPDHILQPGESYVIASVCDHEARQFALGRDGFEERKTKKEIWDIADFQIHIPEASTDATDSIYPFYERALRTIWHGRNAIYIQQNLPNGDSVIIDQVNGVFDAENGGNQMFESYNGGYDVAGVSRATMLCYLVRKYNVQQGNLDFANARGVGNDDSEWIPIPIQGEVWRKVLWTTGNHVNAVLDENTLESDILDIDFAAKTITVPWGVRRADDIMNFIKQKPGIGWNYHVSESSEDSTSIAAKTGDKLEIFACGNNIQKAMFEIIVKEPAPDAKIVVPVIKKDHTGAWRSLLQEGILTWPRVTRNESENDTIWGARGGIPFDTRVDSLISCLEIPSNASYEIEFVDGIQRPDLKNGDILKITAEDGSVKRYYLSLNPYRKSTNATLASITWPDIPDFYKGIWGWSGDTIPGFAGTVFNYKLQIPMDVEGIPALVAKAEELNAKIETKRARNINGTLEDRTIIFTVTAEDDTTQYVYSIELEKEVRTDLVQPFAGEPFISQYIYSEQWANSYLEICNPGTVPLDLSNYMIVRQYSEDPVSAISNFSELENWEERYMKYIPGYKFAGSDVDWSVNPGLLEIDINATPVLQPGDVFVIADIRNANSKGYKTRTQPEIDVDLGVTNAWEEITIQNKTALGFKGGNIFLFKIINDSIKLGLKRPNEITDFELVEIHKTRTETNSSYIRKPEIWKPNPDYLASQSDSTFNDKYSWKEWDFTNGKYWVTQGYGGDDQRVMLVSDIGKHFMIAPTHYKSTVSSIVYKVSEGFSMNEQIRGLVTGTTVSNFFTNIIKANEGQILTVKSKNGELAMDGLIELNDTLVVLSADSTNTTKYLLDVTEEGLSSNALITSSKYIVDISLQPKSLSETEEQGTGTVTGFEYGTTLKTILANITVPMGANLDVVDVNGSYVPLVKLNFDTAYINVIVTNNIYLHVTAENGITSIVYQLVPAVSESDAFVTSDLYNVNQKDNMISLIPRGTNVTTFLVNLYPSVGASIMLVNKMGQERTVGHVADDDKIVVTSPNGMKTKIYFLSKLATAAVPEVTYLAYIESKVYGVDQLFNIVHNVPNNVLIAQFLNNITPAEGANVTILDEAGNVKTSGDIDRGDMVKVVAADGKTTVYYSFGTLVGTDLTNVSEITIYPNPTEDKLNVLGLENNCEIQLFNSIGNKVFEIEVANSQETISMSNLPAGIYVLAISKDNQLISRHKVIRK